MIVADVNGLKMVNDTFGHKEGDRIIQQAATVLKDSCRSEDVVVRDGGDEFVVILPRTSIDTAFQIAERIKQNCDLRCNKLVSDYFYRLCHKNSSQEDIEGVFKEADDMMYRHKLLKAKVCTIQPCPLCKRLFMKRILKPRNMGASG